jgi:GNAT superfamily N-acetyltransferase
VDATEVDVRPYFTGRHRDQLMELFAGQWWTAGRSREQMQAVLDGSQVVFSAVHVPTDRLIGFGRVLTDLTIVALVLDVMVAENWRGHGVGARLMDAVVADSALRSVQSIELVCQPRLFPFYARWGFTEQVGGSRLMRRTENQALLGPVPSATD